MLTKWKLHDTSNLWKMLNVEYTLDDNRNAWLTKQPYVQSFNEYNYNGDGTVCIMKSLLKMFHRWTILDEVMDSAPWESLDYAVKRRSAYMSAMAE